ncbi:DinB family protein [soil metagenome]
MCRHHIEMFGHNRWANLRLFDWCAGVHDALLDSSAPGTFGDARSTLVHLVSAEERYVELLTGDEIPDDQRLEIDDPFPGLELLRERIDASGQRLIAIAGSTPDDHIIEGTFLDGRSYRLSATTLLIQAINHATEHRTHIMTVISQHGVEAPETDGWLYGEEALDPD